MGDGHDAGNGTRLRLARQARGFSQQQLAGMAGVSRQAVSAVESGLSDPSLRVALALTRSLGLTVEELFGPSSPAPEVTARPVEPLGGEGARATLAPMGDGFVALPLAGATASRAGFLPADAVGADPDGDAGTAARVRALAAPRPTLVVAGCDPALPLLEVPLGPLDPPVAFSWWPCSSREALNLAAAGLVHVAGVHLRGPGGEYNISPAAELLPQGGEVIGFCSWDEGLVLSPGLHGVTGFGDVATRRLRLVNREPGAEARSMLDRELTGLGVDPLQLPGYNTQATGHLQLAAAIAAGVGRRRHRQRACCPHIRTPLRSLGRRTLRPGHPLQPSQHTRGPGPAESSPRAMAAGPTGQPARVRPGTLQPAHRDTAIRITRLLLSGRRLLRLARCAVSRGASRAAERCERLLHGHQPGTGGRHERAG